MVIDPVKWQPRSHLHFAFLHCCCFHIRIDTLWRVLDLKSSWISLGCFLVFTDRFLNISGNFLKWLVRYRDQPLREAHALMCKTWDICLLVFLSLSGVAKFSQKLNDLAGSSIQRYSKIFKDIQRYSKIFKDIQRYSKYAQHNCILFGVNAFDALVIAFSCDQSKKKN